MTKRRRSAVELERVRRVQDLRRSSAARPVPAGKHRRLKYRDWRKEE